MSAGDLMERDGPECWVCRRLVDPRAPRGSEHAGSADHVIPRALGGTDAPSNLRLAHRGCNSRRGSRLEELQWPRELPVVEHVRLWPAIKSLNRRKAGTAQLVGVFVSEELAMEAAAWLRSVLAELMGPGWLVELRPLGTYCGVTLAREPL